MTTRYAVLKLVLTPCMWGTRGDIQDNFATWRCVGDTYADTPYAALNLAGLHGHLAPVLEKWDDRKHAVQKAIGPEVGNARPGGRTTSQARSRQTAGVLLRH